MGICPSTLAVTTPSGTYKSIPVPDEIRELAITYEPVNIFKLLGFPDENVTPDEFKARLEERLKMLTTVKKGGATDAQKERVREWLDTTITPANFERITQAQVDAFLASDPELTTIALLREAVDSIKGPGSAYNRVKLPSPPGTSGPALSAQCKAVEEWIYTVEDIRAIKPAELKTLKAKGVNKTALDICMPKVAPGVKYGFAAEDATPVEGTATCKTLLEEAQELVGTIRGDERFKIYRKFLKTRMANDTSKTKTIKPLKAISDSEFLSTCVEIEKTTATGFGFPPKMIGYVILREAIDPFAFLGLPRTATPAQVKAAITSRKALLDGIDKLTKKEKASTKDLRTTCKQGLDEMRAIVDGAGLLEKLKGYVEMRTKKMALYPASPMGDDEFTGYCVEDIPKPSTLVSDVKSTLKTVGTATATGVKTVYDKFMTPIPGENPTPFKNSSDRLSSKDESESSDKPGSLPEPTPSSTGLSPEEELDSMIPSTGPPPGPTGSVSELSTLSGIEKYLKDKYTSRGGTLNVSRTIGSVNGFDKFSDYVFSDFQAINTSSFNHDCLIHSIFISTLEVFREMTRDQQNDFASYFRRTILPDTPQYKDSPAARARLLKVPSATGNAYLDNEDLGKISGLFDISVFVFDKTSTNDPKVPGASIIEGKTVNKNVYMIYNPDNQHYESVRTPIKSLFAIPYTLAYRIRTVLLENSIRSDISGFKTVDQFKEFELQGFKFSDTLITVEEFRNSVLSQIEKYKTSLKKKVKKVKTAGKRRQRTYRKRKGGKRRKTYRKST